MPRVRVAIALLGQGVAAALPSFQEVPGSYLPITPGKVHKDGISPGVLLSDPILAQVTVQVDALDIDCTNGLVDNAKVKANYPNHPLVMAGHFG